MNFIVIVGAGHQADGVLSQIVKLRTASGILNHFRSFEY